MEKIPVKITAEYRGFEFDFSEWSEEWKVKDEEGKEVYSNKDIKKAKEYVDGVIKKEFTPIKALCQERWGSEQFEEITVNSQDFNGDYWVINKKGKREKHPGSSIVLINDENTEKIRKIKEAEKQEIEIQKTISNLYHSLKRMAKEKE